MNELDNQLEVHNEFTNGEHTPRREARVREQDRRRSSTETAMAWHLEAVGSRRPARHRRPEDDGARGATSTRRSSTPSTRRSSRSSSSRASSRRTGRRSTRSSTRWPTCSTSRRTGRSAVPPSTRSSPENPKRPEAAEAAYASVLCYQNIYDRDAQGRRRQEGQRQPPAAPTRRTTRPRRRREREAQAEGLHRQPEGHDHRPSTGTSATSSRPRATRQAQEQLRRGEVRPRAHLLRGAALGGGGDRVPRRRDEPRRPATSASTPRSSTSSR